MVVTDLTRTGSYHFFYFQASKLMLKEQIIAWEITE